MNEVTTLSYYNVYYDDMSVLLKSLQNRQTRGSTQLAYGELTFERKSRTYLRAIYTSKTNYLALFTDCKRNFD